MQKTGTAGPLIVIEVVTSASGMSAKSASASWPTTPVTSHRSPTTTPPTPRERGVGGAATLVQNVETLA